MIRGKVLRVMNGVARGTSMLSKKRLFAGTSLLVLELVLSMPQQADAAPCPSTITANCDWNNSDVQVVGGTIVSSNVSQAGVVQVVGGASVGTLTNGGTIINTNSSEGYGIAGAGTIAALVNNGLIRADPTFRSSGIYNTGIIHTITNAQGAIIDGAFAGINNSGYSETLASGHIDRIVNDGLIQGTKASGPNAIVNGGGGFIGTIENTANGHISSGSSGIYNYGHATIGTITNNGLIDGGLYGIGNNSGTITSISNTTRIYGGTIGIDNTGAGIIQTLNNGGTITGFANAGVRNEASGTIVSLTNTGTISGDTGGVVNAGRFDTLTNSGSISGDYGIDNNGGTIGRLNNGTVGSVSGGIGIENRGRITTLDNSGAITGTIQHGLYNTINGNIATLNNSGTITGIDAGIWNISTIGTLTNAAGGSIGGGSGTLSAGVRTSGGGTITAMINHGVISSAGGGGLANGSSIGTLTNTGTIQGALAAVANSGSIGTLTNSGTLQSAGNAILNTITGTIGQVTNTGLIAGNILNDVATALTIAGGTLSSETGTLTGANGSIGSSDKGMITTSSNLVFSSGHLLLNDDITAAGHTVSNTGATLYLANAVTITGGYSQTGGALVGRADNGTIGYGRLRVTGDAAVSGATITISGPGLTAGQRFVIVDADGTGSYSGNSGYVAVTNGLGASVLTENGNDLVLVLISDSANTYTGKGQVAGGVAAPLGSVLDNIRDNSATSPVASAFNTDVLDRIDALSPAAQGSAIKQLAPTQNAPSSQMSSAAATAVLGAVEQHQQTAMAYDPATGMAAGSDSHDSALWGQFLGGGARRGTNSEADGYSLWDFGLAAGIDHRFSPNAMAGAALSWVRAWSAGSDNSSGSSSILDSYQLTLYGTYRMDRAFVDGQLGVGWNEFNQKRAINFLSRTASAEYSGQQYLAKATVGYDLPVGQVTVTPLTSLRWLRSVTGSYDEEGAGTANLAVDRRGSNSVSQDLGAKVAWEVPTGYGVLKPEVRLAWVHDYTDGPIASSGIMGGQAFAVSVPRTEADGVRIGLAAGFNGEGDVSFRAEYEGELRAQYQSHTGLVKAIWGF